MKFKTLIALAFFSVSIALFAATAIGTNGLESLPSVELRLDINGRPTSPSALTGTRITILVD
jgi:hypothetical protein